jgi:hypothetical protein
MAIEVGPVECLQWLPDSRSFEGHASHRVHSSRCARSGTPREALVALRNRMR